MLETTNTCSFSEHNRSPKTMHRVRVKQTYWLDEESEIRLQQLGAVLTEKVILEDDYYDNDTFDLATSQIWLSQRELQWQLIVAHPMSNAHEECWKAGEQNALVPTSEASRKGKCRRMDDPISEECQRRSPSLMPQSVRGTSGKLDRGMGEGKISQEHPQTTTDPQRARPTSIEAGALDKVEPSFTHKELRVHREIIEYIAQFLQISLIKDEDMKLSHFLQLARIHHYASCHTAKRRTYKLKNTCKMVVEKDELSPRCLATMYIDEDVSNVIKALETMEEIATHLRMDPLQTDQILA